MRDVGGRCFRQRYALLHRRVAEGNERYDVDRAHAWMDPVVRAQIDFRDSRVEQAYHGVVQRLRLAYKRENRAVVRRIR